MLTSRRTITRVKLMALLVAGLLFTAGLITIALSTDYISDLFVERSSAGHGATTAAPRGASAASRRRSASLPRTRSGIGAHEFGERYHPEEVHNVYLSMLLNAGWLGGGIYWILVGLTRCWASATRSSATPTQPLFLIVYAAFVANAVEGIIIDTDHWRHFYLLVAMVWGLMSARTVAAAGASMRRGPRIAAPRRPGCVRRRPSPRRAGAARRASSAPWRTPEPAQRISRRWLSKERPGNDAVCQMRVVGRLGLHHAQPRAQRELRLCDAGQAAAVDELRLADDRRALGVDVDDAAGARGRGRQHAPVAADRHRPDVAGEIGAPRRLRLDDAQWLVDAGEADELGRLLRLALPLRAEPDRAARVRRDVADRELVQIAALAVLGDEVAGDAVDESERRASWCRR